MPRGAGGRAVSDDVGVSSPKIEEKSAGVDVKIDPEAFASSMQDKMRFLRIDQESMNIGLERRSNAAISRVVRFPIRIQINLGGLPYRRLRC